MGEDRRWRHVNHITEPGDADLPVRFFTLSTGQEGWVLAIGRDLRGASRMQQRLLDAQQSMEREYAKVREAETRFRLLFQVASEGVVIISGASLKITDANPAASRVLGRSPQELEGASLDAAFGAAAAEKVQETLLVARKTGRPEPLDFQPEGAKGECHLVASVYRQGKESYFLARVSPPSGQALSAPDTSLSRLAEILPDGLVLTGEDGRFCRSMKALSISPSSTGRTKRWARPLTNSWAAPRWSSTSCSPICASTA
jgi:transcriptional regulator PpsR